MQDFVASDDAPEFDVLFIATQLDDEEGLTGEVVNEMPRNVEERLGKWAQRLVHHVIEKLLASVKQQQEQNGS